MNLHGVAELRIDFHESLGDSHAKGFSLTGDATAVQVGLDVILAHHFGQLERLLNLVLQGGNAKIFFIITVVDHDLTATALHVQAGNCGFSSA